ncbi:hypothetical protein CC80DRAFT_120090 [Byssothecium circinans]|uniref:Uncharacterized protein n=1 Tax=Byssothecium circinans TaxID=147558 RepID=A0A6A5TRE0_9PLEO|nr:hypothetical protein CC80DRAFT_120090 [Byssothecium circinans]
MLPPDRPTPRNVSCGPAPGSQSVQSSRRTRRNNIYRRECTAIWSCFPSLFDGRIQQLGEQRQDGGKPCLTHTCMLAQVGQDGRMLLDGREPCGKYYGCGRKRGSGQFPELLLDFPWFYDILHDLLDRIWMNDRTKQLLPSLPLHRLYDNDHHLG